MLPYGNIIKLELNTLKVTIKYQCLKRKIHRYIRNSRVNLMENI